MKNNIELVNSTGDGSCDRLEFIPPHLSIIIPIYNAREYLCQCIDSILCQKMADFELLLIDDGSTDGSECLCDEYARKDSRIRVFHKLNGGVGSARNIGLDNAQGSWITFIDSDDYLKGDFLSAIERYGEFDLILGCYERIRAKGELVDVFDLENRTISETECLTYLNEHLREDILRCMCMKFFKLSIIEDNHIRFDTRLKFCEDTLFDFTYYQYIKKIACAATGRYVWRLSEGWSAIEKYKCKVEEINILRNELFKIYYDMGLNNLAFERYFLFFFVLVERLCLHEKKDEERKSYYWNSYQLRLEKSALGTLRCYDRWMYKMCKHFLHWSCLPFLCVYLKFR